MSMYLAELAPPSTVCEIVLVDLQWPNPSAQCAGALSTEHLHAEWPVRLYSLRKDMKKGTDLRGAMG